LNNLVFDVRLYNKIHDFIDVSVPQNHVLWYFSKNVKILNLLKKKFLGNMTSSDFRD